jgi:hypothetical protein
MIQSFKSRRRAVAKEVSTICPLVEAGGRERYVKQDTQLVKPALLTTTLFPTPYSPLSIRITLAKKVF